MLFNPKAFIGAHRLLTVCAGLQAGERVVIVTDTNKSELAGLISGQAAVLGAEPTIVTISPRSVDSEEPTSLAAAAMKAADLIVLASTYSLAHARATREAMESNARVLSVTDITETLLSSGGLYADFHAIRPACLALAEIFSNGKRLHVSAPSGTAIEVVIEGQPGNSHDCIVDKSGMFTAIPNIEANVAPVEGYSEGTIVFDASIPNLRVGVLQEHVILEVVEGKVTSITGGAQADLLSKVWADQRDEAVYNLAQVAVGLNPECRFVTGQLTNDHGVLGTMHFGIGTSMNLGGQTQAPMHIDGILWSPTIVVDDKIVIENGQPVGEWAAALNAYLR